MPDAAISPLKAWENFYVIVGSSAGALTGLQFVTMALVAEARAATSMLQIGAFGTPTIVHFCAALLISAILSAPWSALSSAAICLGVCAAFGFAYAITVIYRARRQNDYQPDAEDWFWYIILPLIAYATLLVAAILLDARPVTSLFMIAAVSVLLLFIGIHNAWDTVTYIAVKHYPSSKHKDASGTHPTP